MSRERELLHLATTALRDLYVGFPPREIAATQGEGLDLLLKELVGYLRGSGLDDEGGLDCNATKDIPVVESAPETEGEDPELSWYCPTCECRVQNGHVTFQETHDPRYGGCGNTVTPF